MIDLLDRSYPPTLDEIAAIVRNSAFERFCADVQAAHACAVRIEYSSCSWAPGWNVKFKKSGRTLCTLYPRETYFTALVVVGKDEAERVEALLPACTRTLQQLYRETREGNGQRWLMIDLEDLDDLYADALHLIAIRAHRPRSPRPPAAL